MTRPSAPRLASRCMQLSRGRLVAAVQLRAGSREHGWWPPGCPCCCWMGPGGRALLSVAWMASSACCQHPCLSSPSWFSPCWAQRGSHFPPKIQLKLSSEELDLWWKNEDNNPLFVPNKDKTRKERKDKGDVLLPLHQTRWAFKTCTICGCLERSCICCSQPAHVAAYTS